MRIIVAGLALLLAADLSFTLLARAQPDVPLPAVDVTVKASWGGKIVVSLGDMRGRPLSDVVVTSLGFVVNWGRGQAEAVQVVGRPDTTATAPLVLPASRFQVMAAADLSAFVRVHRCAVRLAAQQVPCPLTLHLTRPDVGSAWRVTSVTIP